MNFVSLRISPTRENPLKHVRNQLVKIHNSRSSLLLYGWQLTNCEVMFVMRSKVLYCSLQLGEQVACCVSFVTSFNDSNLMCSETKTDGSKTNVRDVKER